MKWQSAFFVAIALLPAALPAQEPLSRFTVPSGFVVERIAGPPLVRYPLFACFDDRGRLFVAEGTGTNLPGQELAQRKLGRIVVLEDTDGDGKFDTSRVFADGLVFPQGVLWHDGALYTASHPSIWRLEDTQGSGKADRREEIVTGFKFNGNGCDIHGPFLGPDGLLYWTDGRHGYNITTRDGKHLEGFASRIWRSRLDGAQVERICGGGFDNPVELAWSADGEMFGTMDQGPGDCLLHYIEGGVYPMDHPCVKEFPWTGPMLGAVKKYSQVLPAALCGTMRYRSTAFGQEYRDNLFTTHYMTHKIVRSQLIRDGSTFRAEDSDFLSSSEPNLRLTDVLEDADGSILFVDMGAWFTYGFLGNPLPRPEALGGIYRIRRADAKRVADPWGKKLEIAKRSPTDLIALLDDPRPNVRDRAVEQLGKLGAAAVEDLAAALRAKDASVRPRRNVIWALCRIDSNEALAAVRPALADRDPSVRSAAVHVVGLRRDVEAMEALVSLLKDAEPAMRRRAAEALGRIGKSAAAPALLEALREPADRFLEHAVIHALIQIHDRRATAWGLTALHPQVRRAALIALDQMPDGLLTQEEALAQAASSDPLVQETALEIISRRPNWSAAAHQIMRAWLALPKRTPRQEQILGDLLTAGSSDPAVQEIVADALADAKTPGPTRAFLIAVIGRTALQSPPKAWMAGVEGILHGGDEASLRQTLGVLKSRKWRQFDLSLGNLARQPKLPVDLRMASLECLAARGQPLDDAAFAFLSSHLTDLDEPLLRLSAARTLTASNLSSKQLTQLAESTRKANAMLLRLLLPAFGKTKNPEVGTALVAALQNAVAVEALNVAELDSALQSYPPNIRKDAESLRAKLAARQQGQAAYLAGLSAELEKLPGNPDAGKEIFLSPKVGCFTCHRATGRGGEVGPDLSKIGAFRTKAELLESIIFPSLIIAPEYRSQQVTTKDGRVVTGLVIRDAADALVLRTTELAEIRVPRTAIEDIAPAAVSLMPEGL